MNNTNTNRIRRYVILGSRRFSNYWWASVIFLGALGFTLTGISSYLKSDLVPFLPSKEIVFFPQGLVMSFYGILGLLLSIYLWLTILWNVGGGFNEFNKKEGFLRIFRWGFPGKKRFIDIKYPLKEIEAIRIELKQGINPKQTIYIRIKGKRDIPLNQIGQPLTIEEIEKQAAELAQFLQVSVDGLANNSF
jgi:hypothetical protein|nr:hypothetical chloroplast RF4 [Oedogonium angustistomum]